MNQQNMLIDLHRLCREWERNCGNPDLMEKNQWARGVVFGIKLAIRLVRDHVTAPPSLRGNSDTPY